MLELLLLRHGKAKKGGEIPDAERTLKNSGKRGAQRTGAWMGEHGLVPDCVLCSPAERALITAEKCVKAMGGTTGLIEVEPRLYGADAQTLLNIVIERSSHAGKVMLVGHNPGLDDLVEQLLPASERPQQAPLLPPGTLVHIALPETGALPLKGQGKLLSWVEPERLPESFPYRIAGRIEQRDRPAYYYNQSAVIPYRFVEGELQVLLITSSSGRWWGVPKGIVEPGYSEQDSAAKEALEESGAIGQVHPKLLGRYAHAKWGASCDVSVYAMKVERLLDKEEWDEDHRIRRWVPIARATVNIKNNDLKAIVDRFPEFLKGEGLWLD